MTLRRKGKTILALVLAMLIFLMPLSVYAQETEEQTTMEMTEEETKALIQRQIETYMTEEETEDPAPYDEISDEEVLEDAGLQAQASSSQVPIYRLYFPGNGEHLYTTDVNEKNTLYNNHGWGYEGIAWYASSSGTPVYRLYHPGLGNHLYTTDTNEVKVLTSKHGWKKDNNGKPLFYSSGSVPIYRVYNKNQSGMHHLTTDVNEYNTLPKHGWKQEGVKIYAKKIGSPITTTYSTKTNLANAKKAYKKIVKQNQKAKNGSYQSYYLHDLNSDGIPELLMKIGTCEADYYDVAYTYDKTKQKAVKAGEFMISHTTLYYGNSSNSSGPVRADMFTYGWYVQSKLTLSGTTLKQTKLIDKKDVHPNSIPSHYGKLTKYSTKDLSPLN